MGPIVTDAGPLHYLILIHHVDVLPAIFAHILMPDAVAIELTRPETPPTVRALIDASPTWLERRPTPGLLDLLPRSRGAGERAAIALAQSVGAQLLLIDDRAGDAAARALGLETVGTLGVLVRAAQRGLLDLKTAVFRLRRTNFRCSPDLFDALLTKHHPAT